MAQPSPSGVIVRIRPGATQLRLLGSDWCAFVLTLAGDDVKHESGQFTGIGHKLMTMEEHFDNILNEPRRSGICHRCGNVQTHSLRWCGCCGQEFCNHRHTQIEAMIIASDITFEGGKHAHWLMPYHYAASSYWRNLKPDGYTIKQFQDYIEQKIASAK